MTFLSLFKKPTEKPIVENTKIVEPIKQSVVEQYQSFFDSMDLVIKEKYNINRSIESDTYYFKSKWGKSEPIIQLLPNKNLIKVNNFKSKEPISIKYSDKFTPNQILELIDDNMQYALKHNQVQVKESKEYSLLTRKFTQQLLSEQKKGKGISYDKFANEKQIASFLKKYFSVNYNLDIVVKIIKSDQGFENSFCEVFAINWKQQELIPNEFRKTILEKLYDNKEVKDPNNITYANISSSRVILMVSEWNILFDR